MTILKEIPGAKTNTDGSTTIERYFPASTIGLVTQGGTELVNRKRGVNVHLHYRAGAAVPCCAEVFGNGGDDDGLYAEIGLWFEGKELVDSDGTFSLPGEVATLLRELGLEVPDIFID